MMITGIKRVSDLDYIYTILFEFELYLKETKTIKSRKEAFT